MSPDKAAIYAHCQMLMTQKIAALQQNLKELVEGTANDAKSTAGDKHETALAMMQIEQAKLGKQLDELQQQKNVLDKMSLETNRAEVVAGSLVETDKGLLYLSIALGKLTVNGQVVFALSSQSPLGAKLLGQPQGAVVQMNEVKYTIRAIH